MAFDSSSESTSGMLLPLGFTPKISHFSRSHSSASQRRSFRSAAISVFRLDPTRQCSHYVLMESTGQKRRFPPPWRVEEAGPDLYLVRDANGVRLASILCRDDLQKWSF